MASRTIIQLISDLSGDEIVAGKGETIEFGYRGVQYAIDLTSKEAAAFDKSIATYIDHGSRLGGRRRSVKAPDATSKEIRAWAKGQGLKVPDRGRIPDTVAEQYRSAH